jgi:hypothetical protein
MPIIDDPTLYSSVKREANRIYGKPSAYKSGWIVKTYKQRGGTYTNDGQDKDLKRWFKEDWGDIGGKDYPVYRPFKRVSSATPLTASEIDPQQAKKQIELKQKIKGDANLPAFKAKGDGLSYRIKAEKIKEFSDPTQAQKMAYKYLGKDADLFLSTKKDKKYMIKDPDDKWVHFGQMGFEDFTKHKDEARQRNYLNRSRNIKGNWKDNPYSPNNLSIHILW